MKKLHTLILLFLVFNLNYSQIGIGTNSPDSSSILDIQSTDKGVLLPRLNTSEQDAIGTPATGLLIYNTNLKTFTYYKPLPDETFTWENIKTFKEPKAIEYTGNVPLILSRRQNLNEVSPTNVPILSNNIFNFNEEEEVLYSIDEDDHTITINQDGRYRIIINLSMRMGSNPLDPANVAPEMWISVERDDVDIQLGAFSSTALFGTDIFRTQGSLNITEVFNLFDGDVISIKTNLSANSSNIVLKRPSNVSNIYIEKIR